MDDCKKKLDYIFETEVSITLMTESNKYYIFGWKDDTLSDSISESIVKLAHIKEREQIS